MAAKCGLGPDHEVFWAMKRPSEGRVFSDNEFNNPATSADGMEARRSQVESHDDPVHPR